MNDANNQKVELVPIEQIRVLNPRFRNKKKFQQIVTNIQNLGLKRPITVSRANGNTGKRFDLVCGQGHAQSGIGLRLSSADH